VINPRVVLTKTALYLYRTFALITLYGVLAGVMSYLVLLGFFAVSSSWVAPFIIASTDTQVLDLTGKIVQSQQNIENLFVDLNKWNKNLEAMKDSQKQLLSLNDEFRAALSRQKHADAQDVPELYQLNQRKSADNIVTEHVMHDAAELETQVEQDLKAGLITKEDALQSRMQIRASRNLATDGNIAETMMRDVIRQKLPHSTSNMDTMARRAELANSLVELTAEINTAESQRVADQVQIATLTSAINLAKRSPLYKAISGNTTKFAFVPYDNEVHTGDPVYGCYLMIVICRKVGVIGATYDVEEKITHPLFHTDVRGNLAELKLSIPKAAKKNVLFVGGKPWLF
jgi:hypothetical protein